MALACRAANRWPNPQLDRLLRWWRHMIGRPRIGGPYLGWEKDPRRWYHCECDGKWYADEPQRHHVWRASAQVRRERRRVRKLNRERRKPWRP